MRLNKTRARKNTEEWTIIMASDFWLIAGLGNPGSKYEGTRHNMGFMTADILAERWSVAFSDHKGLAMLGKGAMNLQGRNVKFFLAKPLTYMNLSGKAVSYWMQAEKIPLENVFVIVDDIALPFGTIRIRAKGSDGGHNGLKNIAELLGTNAYARLRFGIGGDFPKGMQIDYVLGEWTKEEATALPERTKVAAEAIKAFGTIGLERTMNQFNNS